MEGTTSHASGHLQGETAIDLRESALRAGPGDRVGVSFYIYDWSLGRFDGLWPPSVSLGDPATYDSLRLKGDRYIFLPVVSVSKR